MFSGKFAYAPILAHFGLNEVLVDSGKFDGECLVQAFDDFLVTLHDN
jgi:hypothetical protein